MKKKNAEETVFYELEQAGAFDAYLEIYGKNRLLLTTVFGEYTSDSKCLTGKELLSIEEHLIHVSGICPNNIYHTVLDIKQGDLLN